MKDHSVYFYEKYEILFLNYHCYLFLSETPSIVFMYISFVLDWWSFTEDIPYFLSYKTNFFSFQNYPKNLDPSNKMDLNLLDFRNYHAKFHKTDLIICNYSREGNILYYSRINMVPFCFLLCSLHYSVLLYISRTRCFETVFFPGYCHLYF